MLGRREEEIAAYDDVLSRYGQAAEPGLRAQVARALSHKGAALGLMNRTAEEVAAYQQFEGYQAALEPAHPNLLASTLYLRGMAPQNLNRNDEAIAIYDEVVRRFSRSNDPEILRERRSRAGQQGTRPGHVGTPGGGRGCL